MDHQTLTMKTVASLREFARENGIRIPAGSLKGQIIDLIEKSIREKAMKETKEEITITNEAEAQKHATSAVSVKEENLSGDKDTPLLKRASFYASSPGRFHENYPTRPRFSQPNAAMDSKQTSGVLEIMPEGCGFLRGENFVSGRGDVFVPLPMIKRFFLKNGDFIEGTARLQRESDKYAYLTFVSRVNGFIPSSLFRRPCFDRLTPVYPQKRIRLETDDGSEDLSLRFLNLIAPIGKGQRGMIVSPPKAGKTTLLKLIAKAILKNEPNIHLILLLIDERPEEVTELKRIEGCECVYSTFDEKAENHARISEMTLNRAQRLVEAGRDVVILLDSITRLARAYNLVIPPTGRSLSGGLDPGALHKPKKFFGSARAIENGGSLTILATALIETGSRMDDIIYEEFKGTGNMEVHLDRKLSQKRIFPAMDLLKSGTRRDDLLQGEDERACQESIRKMLGARSGGEGIEQLISLMKKTKDNEEFIQKMKGWVEVWQREGYYPG